MAESVCRRASSARYARERASASCGVKRRMASSYEQESVAKASAAIEIVRRVIMFGGYGRPCRRSGDEDAAGGVTISTSQ